MKHRLFTLFCLLGLALSAAAQRPLSIRGVVVSALDGEPIPMAIVRVEGQLVVAVTDVDGAFEIKNIKDSEALELTVRCMGYEPWRTRLDSRTRREGTLRIRLREQSLALKDVTVTARRLQSTPTTAYSIDRTALDNQQIMNLSAAMALLPGGKTDNPTLMSDQRISLRSAGAEKGNASFGTAIEVDGMRLQAGALMDETAGASTRSLSTSNIERIEVVTGIPSVEYGDLSNGIVRVQQRRGRTPWTVDAAVNSHTRQVALSKGFQLASGALNASLEHARSFSDQASPYTSYQRNALSLNYNHRGQLGGHLLRSNVGLDANIGGYNSKNDPDAFADTYTRRRDNQLRLRADAMWQPQRPWLSTLELMAGFSYADRQSTTRQNQNSSSAQPYLHGREAGYYLAQSGTGSASDAIVLGPTGYWYLNRTDDSKPMSYQLRLKAKQQSRWGRDSHNNILVGAEATGQGNGGQGTYYAELATAPSWREYRYDQLPWMHTLALYAEDNLMLHLSGSQSINVVAGLRADITHVPTSAYGTTAALSPRASMRYQAWNGRRQQFVEGLWLYGGMGKSVKLPSFEVLYPSPAYADRLAFAAPTGADGSATYAYNILPSTAAYNPQLRWQYALQRELGVEAETRIGRLSLAFYHTTTHRPYMSTTLFTPYQYRFTSADAAIPGATYAIDQATGIVSANGAALPATLRRDYATQTQFVNGERTTRYGLEWVMDFKRIQALGTQLRLDGSYYHYRASDRTLIAAQPATATGQSDGSTYPYVGLYEGSSVYSAGDAAYATVANGSVKSTLSTNLTISTHLPRLRMIVALRIESTLLSRQQALSEGTDRAFAILEASDVEGTPYSADMRDTYVAVYPRYYTTWENPQERLPFAERLAWAKENDTQLYNDLSALILRSNYAFSMNPERISAYFSANLNVTKEIGRHVQLSFMANNFLNTLARTKSSRTQLLTTLYGSGLVPSFYYGLALKLKI